MVNIKNRIEYPVKRFGDYGEYAVKGAATFNKQLSTSDCILGYSAVANDYIKTEYMNNAIYADGLAIYDDNAWHYQTSIISKYQRYKKKYVYDSNNHVVYNGSSYGLTVPLYKTIAFRNPIKFRWYPQSGSGNRVADSTGYYIKSITGSDGNRFTSDGAFIQNSKISYSWEDSAQSADMYYPLTRSGAEFVGFFTTIPSTIYYTLDKSQTTYYKPDSDLSFLYDELGYTDKKIYCFYECRMRFFKYSDEETQDNLTLVKSPVCYIPATYDEYKTNLILRSSHNEISRNTTTSAYWGNEALGATEKWQKVIDNRKNLIH